MTSSFVDQVTLLTRESGLWFLLGGKTRYQSLPGSCGTPSISQTISLDPTPIQRLKRKRKKKMKVEKQIFPLDNKRDVRLFISRDLRIEFHLRRAGKGAKPSKSGIGSADTFS